jgi:PAS domain S-box-containing protein
MLTLKISRSNIDLWSGSPLVAMPPILLTWDSSDLYYTVACAATLLTGAKQMEKPYMNQKRTSGDSTESRSSGDRGDPGEYSALKDRALAAAAEGIVIADARLPDMPLIYVNSGFERLTGYHADSILGRNCRFLQGPGTDPSAAAEIRSAVAEKRECLVEILNYRKDGAPFWNRLSITPVHDRSGQVTHFIGVQSDITARRNAEEALRQAKNELEATNRRMKMELEMAARIQQSLLPPEEQHFAGVYFSWMFRPCVELAGDALNVMPLDDYRIAFYIIDVSGHGVGSALLSVTLNRWLSPLSEAFRSASIKIQDPRSLDITSPAAVARQLNRLFPMMSEIPQYFTMIYGILDQRNGELRFVSAGHPAPIIIPRNGDPFLLPNQGFPIGLLPYADYHDECFRLQPGDRLYFYSDGIPETMNDAEEEFGIERCKSSLLNDRGLSLEESMKLLISSLDQWRKGDSPQDDITLLGMEYRGLSGS